MKQKCHELQYDPSDQIIQNTLLHFAAQEKKYKLIDALIEEVRTPNPLNMRFETPLFNAIKAKDPEMVALLLSKGAQVNHQNFQGQTPLLYALTLREGITLEAIDKILDLLLLHNAKIYLPLECLIIIEEACHQNTSFDLEFEQKETFDELSYLKQLRSLEIEEAKVRGEKQLARSLFIKQTIEDLRNFASGFNERHREEIEKLFKNLKPSDEEIVSHFLNNHTIKAYNELLDGYLRAIEQDNCPCCTPIFSLATYHYSCILNLYVKVNYQAFDDGRISFSQQPFFGDILKIQESMTSALQKWIKNNLAKLNVFIGNFLDNYVSYFTDPNRLRITKEGESLRLLFCKEDIPRARFRFAREVKSQIYECLEEYQEIFSEKFVNIQNARQKVFVNYLFNRESRDLANNIVSKLWYCVHCHPGRNSPLIAVNIFLIKESILPQYEKLLKTILASLIFVNRGGETHLVFSRTKQEAFREFEQHFYSEVARPGTKLKDLEAESPGFAFNHSSEDHEMSSLDAARAEDEKADSESNNQLLNQFEMVQLRDRQKIKVLSKERKACGAMEREEEAKKASEILLKQERSTAQLRKRMQMRQSVLEYLVINKERKNLLLSFFSRVRQPNLTQEDVIGLFGLGQKLAKIPPFMLEETSKGFKLSFENEIINIFHRQHGNPLSVELFNNIRKAFESIGITAKDLEGENIAIRI